MSIALFLRLLPYLITAVVAFGAAWGIQGVRIDGLKVKLEQAGNLLSVCQDANKSSQETIKRLRAEVAGANKLCSTIMSIDSRKTNRVRHIEEITPYTPHKKDDGGKKDEKVDNFIADSSGDALLDELNGMFDGTASNGKDGIHQAADPGITGTAPALSCTMAGSGQPVRLYCLTAADAKNLLKNGELDRSYTDKLRAILEVPE